MGHWFISWMPSKMIFIEFLLLQSPHFCRFVRVTSFNRIVHNEAAVFFLKISTPFSFFPRRNRSTLSQVEFPTEILTGLVFGGPDLSTLFVTTALEASQTVPFAGKLYQVTGLGTTGAASGEFKL